MSDGFIIKREGNGDSGGGEDYSSFKALLNKSITEVTADMLEGITSIGSNAFSNCKSLTSVEIPNSVTNIGISAFPYCTRLTSIEIPNSVTSIGGDAFFNCTSLASITIPNSVTSIGSNAFYKCTSLTSVTIPNSVTSIGRSAFYNCRSLTSVTVEAATPPTLGGVVFNNTNANLVIYVPAGSVDTYKAASGWSEYASRIQAIPSEQLGGS